MQSCAILVTEEMSWLLGSHYINDDFKPRLRASERHIGNKTRRKAPTPLLVWWQVPSTSRSSSETRWFCCCFPVLKRLDLYMYSWLICILINKCHQTQYTSIHECKHILISKNNEMRTPVLYIFSGMKNILLFALF